MNIAAKVYGNFTAKVRYLAAEVICTAEVHITFGDQGCQGTSLHRGDFKLSAH